MPFVPAATVIPTVVPPTAVRTTGAPKGTLSIQINAGSNALSLPYSAYKPSSLIVSINAQGGGVIEVLRWNGKAWQSFKPGGGGDFDIEGGTGYIVITSAPSTWVVALNIGNPITKIKAQKGWDMFGVPICHDGSLSCYTASSLAAAINTHGGAVAELDRMVNGSWSAYFVGYGFNDFPIVVGQGYVLRSTKDVDWTP